MLQQRPQLFNPFRMLFGEVRLAECRRSSQRCRRQDRCAIYRRWLWCSRLASTRACRDGCRAGTSLGRTLVPCIASRSMWGGLVILAAVAADIGPAEIVGENEDDVRAVGHFKESRRVCLTRRTPILTGLVSLLVWPVRLGASPQVSSPVLFMQKAPAGHRLAGAFLMFCLDSYQRNLSRSHQPVKAFIGGLHPRRQ